MLTAFLIRTVTGNFEAAFQDHTINADLDLYRRLISVKA